MVLSKQDEEIFNIIKDEFTLEEAQKIYEDSFIASINNIKVNEEESLNYGKALIILEGFGKLEETRSNLREKYRGI